MAFADKKAAFAYVNEYQKEKYDRITVMAGKGKKAEYQAAAKAAGMSLSAFIEMCVDEKISKGQFKYATIVLADEANKSDEQKGDWKMEVLKAMTAREVLNLIEWLKSKNFTSDDIVDCIESVEGKKKKDKEEKED